MRTLAAVTFAITLAGCTLGPDFKPPSDSPPAAWPPLQASAAASQPTAEQLDIDWWQRFDDPLLTRLIQRAVANNLDLRMAAMRVLQARASHRSLVAERYPSLDAAGQADRSRNSANGLSDPSNENGRHAYNYWDLGLSAAWELDLWGRVRRQVEAANATLEVAENDRRGVLLSLLGDVAHHYIQLREAQATLAVTQGNLEVARHSLRLSQQRFDDGVATRLDVAQGASQVAAIEARVPALEQRRGDAVEALSLLLAEPPRSLDAELSAPGAIPEGHGRFAMGLPSELARRRPDIRQAEAQLHAATASIGVAQADFYPSIRLSGDLGLQSLQLSSLGDWDSRRFAFGPVLSLPLFEGGRLKGALELREAQQQEAALNYRKKVLTAWHEVDQALRGYNASQLRRDALAEAVRQSRTALDTAQRQYVEGAVDFLNVLTLQGNLLTNQEQWVASNAQTSDALVALYSALGGGWQAFDEGPHTAAR
ncbi:efflux transporter outer membrane subunit [Pseudomonas sp. RIT-PI-S]|uniref:efflux transporter outer membrane subunit n=1 Tax=Pseudomonas sp. RIT-PI-S TaxID=3035295 RepID=UPI0021D88F60|nr:efflux transporter outer membrane subunit [Pseudomonas sp. RIT-PI-S]